MEENWREVNVWEFEIAFVSGSGGPLVDAVVFCLCEVDQSAVVLVYCRLGKLKAGEVLFIRMFHHKTKTLLSRQLKSLLVPSIPTLLSP